jgi:hypothetical protein
MPIVWKSQKGQTCGMDDCFMVSRNMAKSITLQLLKFNINNRMRRYVGFILFILVSQVALGQKSYIQVTGEPGLSVFLNDQFKGKTTAEFGGYIVENVTPGKNSIKIVKEGYTAYEEFVTVKAGEVFAYKVKPFAKHAVSISEKGNNDETDKKQSVPTGKLTIQSLPIEIKITIPKIEGVSNRQKTKDEWMVNKIPAGKYAVQFVYNEKNVETEIEIKQSTLSSVFVNMLNGEVTIQHSPIVDEEKERLEKAEAERLKREEAERNERRRKDEEMRRQFERQQQNRY